jgi:RNA polymerase primary sigma factor
MTLEAVGRKFNVTRERIRQIEQLALIKLRRLLAEQESQHTSDDIDREEHHRSRVKALGDYLDSQAGKSSGLS